MKYIKLTKLKEATSPLHPNNIPEGYEKKGFELKGPTVGECYFVGSLRTSTVQEIIDENTFRTHNSIYRIEELEEPKLPENE